MAIIESSIKTISEYLKDNQLDIPHYQRPYKWTSKNVIQLIDDIDRFKSDTPYYRIGTIVIHQEKKQNKIVDGQQRTVTFLLMLKVLYGNCPVGVNVGLKSQLSALHDNSFKPGFKDDISKENIQKNYHTIKRKLNNVDSSFVDFFLNKCEVTTFVIDDVSEAFQFFDSQNARGRDLDPHDLLKAFHLREMHTKNHSVNDNEVRTLVADWEKMDGKRLATLFAEYLYRIRGWSKGNSSRYFGKKDTEMFKGITLDSIEAYPYTQLYRNMVDYLQIKGIMSNGASFPFQLDQTIINGKYFFEMISHYNHLHATLYSNLRNLSELAQEIIHTLDTYNGRIRTGDKYVRMLFDCALLFYIDKFGDQDVSKAIEKIFIWAFRIRLTYQNLQLVSVDNYVVREINLFKRMKEAILPKELDTLDLPLLTNDFQSEKTSDIKNLFIKMNYYAN